MRVFCIPSTLTSPQSLFRMSDLSELRADALPLFLRVMNSTSILYSVVRISRISLFLMRPLARLALPSLLTLPSSPSTTNLSFPLLVLLVPLNVTTLRGTTLRGTLALKCVNPIRGTLEISALPPRPVRPTPPDLATSAMSSLGPRVATKVARVVKVGTKARVGKVGTKGEEAVEGGTREDGRSEGEGDQ